MFASKIWVLMDGTLIVVDNCKYVSDSDLWMNAADLNILNISKINKL